MSYKKVYLEWSIDSDSLYYGVPVGFEVDLSLDKNFNEVTTTFTTFNEVNPTGAYRFYYSIDDGVTWIQYPWGEQGQTFYKAFKVRLEINPSDLGYTLLFNNGTLRKISSDSKTILNSVELEFEDIIDVDQYGDILYLVGSETIYKINGQTLEPYNNSLPLLDNALGIVIDEKRQTFWQVNKNSIWLRSIYGDVLWSVAIPDIDINFTSSSSSSSTSSSSTSSESSESVGNISSSTSSTSVSSSSSSSTTSMSSSSSSSESSMGEPTVTASGFTTFPEFNGVYHAVSIFNGHLLYHNDNGCILQYDYYPSSYAIYWKLYLNEQNRTWARSHYIKSQFELDQSICTGNYLGYMWWDTEHKPSETGTIS